MRTNHIIQELGRVLNEPSTRELLRVMLLEGKVLEPSVAGDGRVHYALADSVLGMGVDTAAWINEMTSSGVLKMISTKDVVMCPTHMRADPVIQVECVKCKSRSSKKASLVEHISCGYIGDDSKFAKDEMLVCPNCKKPVRAAGELRVSGIWYECQNCLAKTSSPRLVFVCKEGDHVFSTSDLALAPLPSYSVNERVVYELRNALELSPAVAHMLSQLGFEVSSPAMVQGQSGAKHALDIYATKGDKRVLIQVVVRGEEVDGGSLISFFAKTFDIRPTHQVLIAIPRASAEAKQLAGSYGVSLVEDFDGSGAVEKVRRLLEGI